MQHGAKPPHGTRAAVAAESAQQSTRGTKKVESAGLRQGQEEQRRTEATIQIRSGLWQRALRVWRRQPQASRFSKRTARHAGGSPSKRAACSRQRQRLDALQQCLCLVQASGGTLSRRGPCSRQRQGLDVLQQRLRLTQRRLHGGVAHGAVRWRHLLQPPAQRDRQRQKKTI